MIFEDMNANVCVYTGKGEPALLVGYQSSQYAHSSDQSLKAKQLKILLKNQYWLKCKVYLLSLLIENTFG